VPWPTPDARRVAGAGLILSALVLLGGCALPSQEGWPSSHAPAPSETAATVLGQAVEAGVRANPGKTGIHALAHPQEAFAARALLARAAEKTLDVQYYIWRKDVTGLLLLEELRAAAERGVRVRLLLDDNGIAGLDPELAALDAHPKIEVRLFNPFSFRPFKPIGYLTHFPRANRRMHNKSFTADNQASVLGGRNVGDEYFGATEGVLFADLDVMALGPAVQAVSRSFDAYWASASAYPLAALVPPAGPGQLGELAARAAAVQRSPQAAAYMEAVRQLDAVQRMLRGELPLEWAPAHLVSDDPSKGQGRAAREDLLIHGMAQAVGVPGRAVDLVSPYFVPTRAGADYFAGLARRGIAVRILTNSLAATDVAAVHAGYAKYRRDLLQAGVRLYELKSSSFEAQKDWGAGAFGSSGSSLHAKTFAVDGARIFVGSFNFDPRSAQLNTELGLVIDSPALAAQLHAMFGDRIPASAYEVRIDAASGALFWLETVDGKPVRHDAEPGTGLLRRVALAILSVLPIEWLL